MNYDLKSNPGIGAGPSSPIDDYCAPSGAKFGSAASSVAAWSSAGIPHNKLVLGVGAYGHSRIVSSSVALNQANSSLNSYPAYNPANTKIGDKWDGEGGLDVCGAMQGPGGVYTYWGLIEEGILKADGSAGEGIVLRYDECSETVCETLTLSLLSPLCCSLLPLLPPPLKCLFLVRFPPCDSVCSYTASFFLAVRIQPFDASLRVVRGPAILRRER